MTLQIGVIGCGAIGQDHIRRVSQALSGARVVAVTDIAAQQARDAMARYGSAIEVMDSGQALIAAPQVQALLVTSWGPTHEELVLAAIAQGKPVFCEKPLAVTAAG
jgi:myo-inositol 2-dehydrogenase/D-chiro-inositol 1-dehydrogenase